MSASSLAEKILAASAGAAERCDNIALHTVDCLAVLESGANTSEGRLIAKIMSAGDAASGVAALAAIGRFTECDDIHIPSCMTAGCIVIPTALKFATDARRFAAAVEAGYAVGLALAQAVGGVKALAQGVWPALLAAPAVAAVTAGVGIGFDAAKTAKALALSLSGASGRAGRPVGMPSGRWIVFGEAVRKGVNAALATQLGVEGDTRIPDRAWLQAQAPAGLASAHYLEELPDNALAAFGLKPFVAARQGANAIEAFRRVLAEGTASDDIAGVEIFLPPDALGVVSRPVDPAERLSKIANLALQLGIAAYEPDRLLDIARHRPIDPRCYAFAGKVVLKPDTAMSPDDLATWAARIVVKTAKGDIEQRCRILSGDPRNASRRTMLEDKIASLPDASLARSLGDSGTIGWREFFQSTRRAYAQLSAELDNQNSDLARRESAVG